MGTESMDIVAMASKYWSEWDDLVANFVFGTIEKAFDTEIRANPCPHTFVLPAVRTPTILVTWAILYLIIVGLGLLTITPADKTKKVSWREEETLASTTTSSKVYSLIPCPSSFLLHISFAPSQTPTPAYLKTLMNFHNVFLILLSSFMFLNSCYQAYVNNYSFWAQPYDVKEVGMARGIYIFYISKLYEYFDTYIMLLKGNLNQVSFLHVYHHLSISMIWWAIAYSAPGGDAWYSAALNSLVHVAMYTYYFLASLSSSAEFRKKYLW